MLSFICQSRDSWQVCHHKHPSAYLSAYLQQWLIDNILDISTNQPTGYDLILEQHPFSTQRNRFLLGTGVKHTQYQGAICSLIQCNQDRRTTRYMCNNGPVHKRTSHVPKDVSERDSALSWFESLILPFVNAKLFQIRILKCKKKGVLDRDPHRKPDSRTCERKALSERDSCMCILEMRAEAMHGNRVNSMCMGQSARTAQ